MNTPRFLRAASWPAKSARSWGRSATSSSGRLSAETRRRGASAISGVLARRSRVFRAHGETDQVRGRGADKARDRTASDEGEAEPCFDSIEQGWVDPFGGPRAGVGLDRCDIGGEEQGEAV